MTSYSWMYGRGAPLQANPLQVQATAFASSSLSSQANHQFALDYGGAQPHLTNEVKGLAQSGAEFSNEDRSPLGVMVERHRRSVKFSNYPEMSTPNVDSLSRSKTQLKGAPKLTQFNRPK